MATARQSHRLPAGGIVNRERAVEFSFDGRAHVGFEGDTLASALLASGRHLVARSIKYHRPRGIVAAGVEEPNAVVVLGAGARAIPNARATQVEIYPGLSARSLNRWPSLTFDAGAVAERLGGLIGAGFYYKTFMWPRFGWHLYEAVIRRAAGLGKAPGAPDPDGYEHRYAHCDVLVVGAGAAGLGAALAAARSGARVLLAEQGPRLGGGLLDVAATVDRRPAGEWAAQAERRLSEHPRTRVLKRTTCAGYYDHNFLVLCERRTDHLPPGECAGPRERLWLVRANRVILATGALERPLLFADNDRPGIMLAGAVSTYINRYAVLPGRRAVLYVNNDHAYGAAFDLSRAGAAVTAVDTRASTQVGAPVWRAARSLGFEILAGHRVVEAEGHLRVSAARVAPTGDADRGWPARRIRCDLLAVSGGFSPTVHLHAQSGGVQAFDAALGAHVPGAVTQAQESVGACRGELGLAAALEEGLAAGSRAARAAGYAPAARQEISVEGGSGSPAAELDPHWEAVRTGQKAFVDLQNDTTVGDLRAAAAEGLGSIEHAKRYTALGLGTDQGKLGNLLGAAVLARAAGDEGAAVRTTTYRPPYTPVSFGAAAGMEVGGLFDPTRITPIHGWHRAAGAVFEPVGQWLRARYYPRAGEDMDRAVRRECRAVRTGVGLLDASTFGKIDVRGADASEFLNRVYVNGWTRLEVGHCRYGLMLGEDGMVLDDGVTTRLAPDHFLMTTTTGGAAQVLGWLERWLQTEWPDLDVFLTSVTDHFATLSVGGPDSRRLLSRLDGDIDLSEERFPFMTSREGRLGGLAVRIARISFHGELGYEIYLRTDEAHWLWQGLMEAGADLNITPYGTEAMHVLRAEKGYIIVGQDTDGSVTPIDLGLERMCSRQKDFLGKRSLSRPDCRRPDRKRLVGLLTRDPVEVLPEGAQLVGEPFTRLPAPMVGHVTSSYWSESLGRSIALALVRGGRGQHASVWAPLADGRCVECEVTEPCFYDPTGARLRG